MMLALDQGTDNTIRVNVNLVQLDVTVTDKAGKHVPDLTAADFEVSRNGKRQTIKSVLFVPGQRPGVAPVEKAADQAMAAMPSAPLPVKQLRVQDVRRTVALMIDDLSMSFSSSFYARAALRKFVEESIQPGDLVALFRSSSGLGVLQQFTSDKRQILSAIDRTKFRAINSVDSLAPMTDNPAERDPTLADQAMEQRLRDDINDRVRQDMITTGMLASANVVVQGLSELPGRKSLVLFSESVQVVDTPRSMTNPGMSGAMQQMPGAMGGTRDRTLTAIRKLIDTSNRSGVVLYTIDPRGLVYTGITAADQPMGDPRKARGQMQQRQIDFDLSQDGMAMLAEETGGVFYRNSNDLGGALKAALDDQEGYYLVAFQPDDATFEKAKAGGDVYHNLHVKLKRPGLRVRYRRGLYGVTDEQRLPKPVSPMAHAMVSPFRSVEVPIKMTPLFVDDEKLGSFLRTLLHIDASEFTYSDVAADKDDKNQTAWKQTIIDELVMLFNESGQQVETVSKTHTIKVRGDAFKTVMRDGMLQELDIAVKKPGPYQLRAAIMDQTSKKTGSSAQFIEVPDLKNKRLAMSDLALSSLGWMERSDVAGGPARRIIKPGSKLAYAAYIYNATVSTEKSTPNLETQVVLFRDGKVVFTGKKTPFQPKGASVGSRFSIDGSMQLGAATAPGEYVLQVAVHDIDAPKKQQFSVRSIDFEIRP